MRSILSNCHSKAKPKNLISAFCYVLHFVQEDRFSHSELIYSAFTTTKPFLLMSVEVSLFLMTMFA